jgi:hypothetical protein
VLFVFAKILIFSFLKKIRREKALQKYEIVLAGGRRGPHFCPRNAEAESWRGQTPALPAPRRLGRHRFFLNN